MSAQLVQRAKSMNGSESEVALNGVVHKLNGNDRSNDASSPEASPKSPPSEEPSCTTPLANPQVHSHCHANNFAKLAWLTDSHVESSGCLDLHHQQQNLIPSIWVWPEEFQARTSNKLYMMNNLTGC